MPKVDDKSEGENVDEEVKVVPKKEAVRFEPEATVYAIPRQGKIVVEDWSDEEDSEEERPRRRASRKKAEKKKKAAPRKKREKKIVVEAEGGFRNMAFGALFLGATWYLLSGNQKGVVANEPAVASPVPTQ